MQLLKYYWYNEFKYTVPMCTSLMLADMYTGMNIPVWLIGLPLYFTLLGVLAFCLLAGLSVSVILFLSFFGIEV